MSRRDLAGTCQGPHAPAWINDVTAVLVRRSAQAPRGLRRLEDPAWPEPGPEPVVPVPRLLEMARGQRLILPASVLRHRGRTHGIRRPWRSSAPNEFDWSSRENTGQCRRVD